MATPALCQHRISEGATYKGEAGSNEQKAEGSDRSFYQGHRVGFYGADRSPGKEEGNSRRQG